MVRRGAWGGSPACPGGPPIVSATASAVGAAFVSVVVVSVLIFITLPYAASPRHAAERALLWGPARGVSIGRRSLARLFLGRRRERDLRRPLRLEIGDRALDGVLRQDRAMDLHRRQMKLLGDHAVL